MGWDGTGRVLRSRTVAAPAFQGRDEPWESPVAGGREFGAGCVEFGKVADVGVPLLSREIAPDNPTGRFDPVLEFEVPYLVAVLA